MPGTGFKCPSFSCELLAAHQSLIAGHSSPFPQNECFPFLFNINFSSLPDHTHSSHVSQETRTRYWNAYMLFYKEVDKPSRRGTGTSSTHGGVGVALGEEPGTAASPLSPMPETGDKLAQLQVIGGHDESSLWLATWY